MASPHVLLVLASPAWGGTEKAFVELANALSAGRRVTVAIPSGADYVDRLSGSIDVRTLPPGSRRNPLVIRRLARLIRDVGADVVHTHAAKASEMVYWASRVRRVTQVATKHNTRGRWIFSRVRWVTAVSEAAKASIDHPSGVAVVYNGVDVVACPPVPKSETLAILAVGRLHRHKAFDVLIREVSGLPFPWRLEIAGAGPERAALARLVDELGLDEVVTLLGHREDVSALMSRAHVQVVSSRTEGFSLALVEGLYCCDVVLSTRVGIAGEILPDELLLEMSGIADRLADVQARYEDYVRATRAARAAIGDRFLQSHTTMGYVEVYERAMAE